MEETLNCDAVADRELVERYLARKLSESEVEAFESHYLTCLHCQNELRLAVGVRDALQEVRRAEGKPEGMIRPRTSLWFRRPSRLGGAAAAIAAVLVGVLLVQSPDREPLPYRDEVPESTAVPTAEAPVGEVQTVDEFRWTAVVSADLYRVTLYDSAGEILWQADTRETQVQPPDSVRLEGGPVYLWQVDARVGWDRWVSSDLVRFSLPQTSSGRES